MHRLRNRKKSGKEEKAKDDSATAGASASKSAFKRNKSQPPPANRQQPIDLTAALPSSDDFRTSLLMPNLEKRFSVLREDEKKQNAAGTPAGPGVNGIGYGALASGALSGLDDGDGKLYRPPFGNAGGLHDIAETASLSGSIHTSSARNSGSDDSFSGVMSRGRPAEGNVLFGGRQKVFKVSTAAGRSDDSTSSPISPREGRSMGGRTFYSDDLPSGDRRGRGRYREDESDRGVSPLGLYNRDRNTTSSTGSSDPMSTGRSSTAATSVASHSTHGVSSPAVSKPRRPIYERALDMDLPQEDAFSNQKAEIIANIKPRAMSPIPGMYPDEVYNRRELSPPPPPSKAGINSRPLSPEDDRKRSMSPSNQNDRFHFVNRVGMGASIASNLSVPSRKQSADDQRVTSTGGDSLASFDFGLGLNTHNNSNESRSQNGHQTVTNISGLPTPLSPNDEFKLGPEKSTGASREPSPLPSPNPVPSPQKSEGYEDFKIRDDRSSYESGFIDPTIDSLHNSLAPEPLRSNKAITEQAPSIATFFDGNNSSASSDSGDSYRPVPLQKDNISPPYKSTAPANDSPTLPAQGGLSSMVRQHLRSASGASSIYPASILPKQTDEASWDAHEWEVCEPEAEPEPEPEPEPEEAPKPKLSLAELKKKDAEERMMRTNDMVETARRLTTESERSNDEWENELEARKRAIQMKLQGQLSGRNSPAPGYQMEVTRDSPFKSNGALSGMLKSKGNGSSRDELKAMKMLGMGPQPGGVAPRELNRKASQEDYRQNLGNRMRAPSDPRVQPRPMGRAPELPGSLPHGPASGRGGAPPISPPANQPPGQRKIPGHIPISALQQKFEQGSRQDNNMSQRGPMPPHALPSPADRRRNRRPQGPLDDDLRPPHERPPHDRQNDGMRGRHINGMPSMEQLRDGHKQASPPKIGPGLPKGPKQPSPPRMPNGRKRSDEDFRPMDQQPLGATNNEPGNHKMQAPKDDLREAMARGQSSAAFTSVDEKSRLQAKKAAQQTLAPMENVQSRFSMEEPPASKSFAGRVRSNSRATRRPSEADNNYAPPPPPPIQTTAPPQLSVTTHGMYQNNSAANTSTTLVSSFPASPATTVATQGSNLTLADIAGVAPSPAGSPGFTSSGPANLSREGKKGKVRKTDIGEPKLLSTTSTMPASNLMNAGPKAVAPPAIFPAERTSPPRVRRGTQEDDKPSRPAYMGHRLKKSLSDGNGLAERAKATIPHSSSHNNLQEVSHPSWPSIGDTIPGGMI